MPYLGLLIVILTIVLMIFVRLHSKSHKAKQDEITRRFFEEEDAANFVRKKDISPELFYTADLSEFPEIPEDDPYKIKRCAKRTMIHFKEPVTNLELKKQYGPAQMDIIAHYEENFHEYMKALTQWAVSLSDENQANALIILEKVISLGGELRDTYKFSADIYAAKGDAAGMDALLSNTEKNHFKDPAIRRQVLDYINMKKEELLK